MTDTIEQKALALLDEVAKEMGLGRCNALDIDLLGHRTLLRAIEQHEAFRQEVSDAVEKHLCTTASSIQIADVTRENLARFIIAKPDPLVEALNEALLSEQDMGAQEMADNFRAALAARGLTITETKE